MPTQRACGRAEIRGDALAIRKDAPFAQETLANAVAKIDTPFDGAELGLELLDREPCGRPVRHGDTEVEQLDRKADLGVASIEACLRDEQSLDERNVRRRAEGESHLARSESIACERTERGDERADHELVYGTLDVAENDAVEEPENHPPVALLRGDAYEGSSRPNVADEDVDAFFQTLRREQRETQRSVGSRRERAAELESERRRARFRFGREQELAELGEAHHFLRANPACVDPRAAEEPLPRRAVTLGEVGEVLEVRRRHERLFRSPRPGPHADAVDGSVRRVRRTRHRTDHASIRGD